MTFAAVAIVFLIACVAVGSRTRLSLRTGVAATVAALMVLAQLALMRS